MSRKTKNAAAEQGSVATAIETKESVAVTPEVTVTVEKVIGRPVNPTSARQKRLAEKEAKLKAMGGYIPLGRQADPNSKRQQKLREIAAKKADGVEVKRGRRKMTEEQKAQARAERQAKYEAWLASQGKTVE